VSEKKEPENFEFNSGGNMEKVDENLEVGLIEDPDAFDIGIAATLDNALLIVFSPKDLPKQAIGFKGEAQEKLLFCIKNLLESYYGAEEVERESPSWIAPETKKTPTLH
jgi:hypothetical protein